MPTINSATVTQAIVKYVASLYLPALRNQLYMANLVNRDYEPTLASTGDSVSIPIAPQMVVNNLAEANAVQPQAPAPGNAQLILNTHIEATFAFNDIAKVLASPDLFGMYFGASVNAAAERVESDILGLYPEFTFNAALGTAGSASPSEADIDSAETVLFKAKVGSLLQKYLILDADSYGAVRKLPRFTEMQTSGNGQAIATGVLGRIKDFMVVRSAMIPKTTVAGTTTTHNLAFVKDAIVMAMRKLPAPLPGTGAIAEYVEVDGYGFRVLISYDANYQVTQVTVDGLYGVAPLRNGFAVELQS